MKSKITGHIAKIGLFAAVLLTTYMFAGPANAQSNITGKFTLPYEARWGQAVLPPGDYQLTFVNNNAGTMLLIRDAKSLRGVAFESVANSEQSGEGPSALLIGTKGKQRVVYSLTITELGEAFVYERPTGRGSGSQGSGPSHKLSPVTVAKK